MKTKTLAGTAAALSLGIFACGGSEVSPVTAADEPAPVQVRVEAVRAVEKADRVAVIGLVKARRTVVISARVVGQIRAVHVREGQRVAKGQRLIELDDRELRSALDAALAAGAEAESAIAAAGHEVAGAAARLELAEATHRRFSRLLEKESVSRQEYDETAARLAGARAAHELAQSGKARTTARKARAEAQISSAEVMLGYARIDSPVSGLVTARLADEGSLAAPGRLLLKMEPSGEYRLEIGVPESAIGSIRAGDLLDVAIDALGDAGPRSGRVAEIVPLVDPSSRTFTVKLALEPHRELRSGLYGRAFLTGETRDILTVPAGAVIERGQLQSVLVVEQGRARTRLVTAGEIAGGRREILSGLDAGEAVILEPAGIADGAPVGVTGGEASR